MESKLNFRGAVWSSTFGKWNMGFERSFGAKLVHCCTRLDGQSIRAKTTRQSMTDANCRTNLICSKVFFSRLFLFKVFLYDTFSTVMSRWFVWASVRREMRKIYAFWSCQFFWPGSPGKTSIPGIQFGSRSQIMFCRNPAYIFRICIFLTFFFCHAISFVFAFPHSKNSAGSHNLFIRFLKAINLGTLDHNILRLSIDEDTISARHIAALLYIRNW